MVDTFDETKRSSIMRCVQSKDTRPEMIVRRALHRMGHRYHLHDKRLPGKPDLVLPRHSIAVFVHGCFWHWHGCKRCRMPKSNTDYWEKKIQMNVERDVRNKKFIEEAGWKVVVIWECDVQQGIVDAVSELQERR